LPPASVGLKTVHHAGIPPAGNARKSALADRPLLGVGFTNRVCRHLVVSCPSTHARREPTRVPTGGINVSATLTASLGSERSGNYSALDRLTTHVCVTICFPVHQRPRP
jgi:hypothetical protein